MTLTHRGWAVLVIAAASFVVARVLTAIEFYILGTTLVALTALSALHSLATRLDIEVVREIHPPKPQVGSHARVELEVRNTARRRTPPLVLDDQMSGTRPATITVGSIGAGHSGRFAHRLPTERRGLMTVGPLRVSATGPLGLTRTSRSISGSTLITVLPRIDTITPVGLTVGADPMAGAVHPNALGHGGEDFYTLRRYVVGDDFRRIHWPSTARHDELMVRQEELPWQGRTTIFVDVRRDTTTPESLELVISAAASIVSANATRQDLVRLVGTDGSDSGFAAGHTHVTTILEHLARVGACDDPGFIGIVDRLARTSTSGALVVVAAEIDRHDLDVLVRLKNHFGSVTLVLFERHDTRDAHVGAGPNGHVGAGDDIGRDTGRDVGRDPGRDVGRDVGRDTGRDPGRDVDLATVGSTITPTDERPFADSWNSAIGPHRPSTGPGARR